MAADQLGAFSSGDGLRRALGAAQRDCDELDLQGTAPDPADYEEGKSSTH